MRLKLTGLRIGVIGSVGLTGDIGRLSDAGGPGHYSGFGKSVREKTDLYAVD